MKSRLLGIANKRIRASDSNLKSKCKYVDDNLDNDFCFGILKNYISELECQVTEKDTAVLLMFHQNKPPKRFSSKQNQEGS